jgi:hypothetical protein
LSPLAFAVSRKVGGGGGGAAFETLGKPEVTPTIAMVRIRFSFIVAPLDPSRWRFVVKAAPLGRSPP